MNSIHQVDELVKEYLLFRGFVNTFRSFETESRADKDKGFQVDKIIEELLGYITASDIASLIDYWRYLDVRYFSRLDSRFQRTVKKFELCLLRHYLVYGMRRGGPLEGREGVVEIRRTRHVMVERSDLGMVSEGGTSGLGKKSPHLWINHSRPNLLTLSILFAHALIDSFPTQTPRQDHRVLRHLRHRPVHQPRMDAMVRPPLLQEPCHGVHLRDFLLQAMAGQLHRVAAQLPQHHLPKHALLTFNVDRLQRRSLQVEVELLRSVIEQLRAEVETGGNEISSLKQKVRQSQIDQSPAQRVRRRASSLVDASRNGTPKAANTGATATNTSVTSATAMGSGSLSTTVIPVKSRSSSGASIRRSSTSGFNPLSRASVTAASFRGSDSGSPPSTPLPSQRETETASRVTNTKGDGEAEREQENRGRTRERERSRSRSATPESSIGIEEEPFMVLSQDDFLEHNSGIVHARFSSEGNLIASCDMDNIVRIWSYSGLSPIAASKINNHSSNVLALEWEARSDRFLFLGTDASSIRLYNTEAKSIVHEFVTEDKFPRVTQLSCSPVEPIFVSAGAARNDGDSPGVLVSWNMKSMTKEKTFSFEPAEKSTAINTIRFNHNGQMLVAGDEGGFIRIFDIRKLMPIMEWLNPTGQALCSAQFSFDENSIFTVDDSGMLTEWSIHKPGTNLSQNLLPGFPPSPPFTARPTTASPDPFSPISPILSSTPPRLKRRPSNSSVSSRSSRLSIRSSRNTIVSPPAITFDDSVTQNLLSRSPRSQMVAFSADTEHVLAASSAAGVAAVAGALARESSLGSGEDDGDRYQSLSQAQSHQQQARDGDAGLRGLVYQSLDGLPVQPLAPHTQPISVVDWAGTVNACLTGGMDGTIKVTKLIKVT
ncbi:WD40-repeat-containing domain protein [Jimgerdemannia flammicorona]|uniref:WD40-repeat-containing domain protein n=1 Tax=Jimgerdemannia flammicorona TaxID=994334 RepID=A0A433CYM1_9FUNG|nr:WD40-repeat-containing domain protein [Jimgerdemannia flammicorona]